jgi:hypothetical protein
MDEIANSLSRQNDEARHASYSGCLAKTLLLLQLQAAVTTLTSSSPLEQVYKHVLCLTPIISSSINIHQQSLTNSSYFQPTHFQTSPTNQQPNNLTINMSDAPRKDLSTKAAETVVRPPSSPFCFPTPLLPCILTPTPDSRRLQVHRRQDQGLSHCRC